MWGIFLYPAREMPHIPPCEREPCGAAFRISDILPCPSAWKRSRSELDRGLRRQTQRELRKKRAAIRAESLAICSSHNEFPFARLIYCANRGDGSRRIEFCVS
jgi:hypothetical protein